MDSEGEVEDCKVRDSLIGLTALYPNLGLFKFGNVVVQKNFSSSDSVLVVSGGPSGFEPLFAGYVGTGMLTAAIQGDIHTSPPVKLILRTLRELGHMHMHGILVIVHGSIGNELSFGLATSKATSELIRLKMLIVSEACVNKNIREFKQEGLAGIVLVFKVAGAMANNKELMTDVHQFCLKICQNMSSSIVSASCDLSQTREQCICRIKYPPNTVEVGRGLQGEPGERKINAQSLARELFDCILEQNKLNFDPDDSVVLLLGNVGRISKMEEWAVAKELLEIALKLSIKVVRFYTGNFVTSDLYVGLTLTVLKVFDPKLLEYLDVPCNVPAWKNMTEQKIELLCDSFVPSKFKKVEPGKISVQGPAVSKLAQFTMSTCLNFSCAALISCENQLNIMDSEKGDGDTGSRIKNACQLIENKMKQNKISTTHPFAFFDYLANLLENLVGGTMGALYGILFRTMANSFISFPESTEVTPNVWLTALEKSVEALKMPCIYDEEGTMYDPLYVFAIKVREKLGSDPDHPIDALMYGLINAEHTVPLTKRGKRKYPDSGAHAVGIWLRAIVEGIKLRVNLD